MMTFARTVGASLLANLQLPASAVRHNNKILMETAV